jgi:apolipoprotein D and lipocalin family protein
MISLLFSVLAFANLETVDFVDPARYVGNWYQVAGNPMPFEPKNCECALQSLSLSDRGIEVLNTCQAGGVGGPVNSIRGVARPEDSTNAKLEVDFGLPRKGKYWVIGLDPDYRWAVVSDPSKYSLYILSKTPELPEELFNQALEVAKKQLDLSRLRKNIHTGCSYP